MIRRLGWHSGLFVLSLVLVASARGAEKGLVARWDMNQGAGSVLKDAGGTGHRGTIHGATWVKRDKGFALQFDGVDDWVNVPWSKRLDSIEKQGTLEFWYKLPADAGFPGILTIKSTGMNWADMRLAVFVRDDGPVFAYIADGKKYTSVSALGARDEWTYFVLTWDGKHYRAYTNGVLTGETACTYGPEITGFPLWIGRTQGITQAAYFKGQLDDMAIYDYALSEAEIRHRSGAVLAEAAGNAGLPTKSVVRVPDRGKFLPIEPPIMLAGKELRVMVSSAGKVQIDAGRAAYMVESCWPYPGAGGKIGWNGLPRAFNMDNYPDVTRQLGAEGAWAPKVTRAGRHTIRIKAAGRSYRLERTVNVVGTRIDIDETFTNLRNVPTAIFPRHRITARDDFLARFSTGLEVSANPTIFLAGPNGGLGVVLQDSVSRRRIRPWLPWAGNRAGFHLTRVALDKGATRTFSWSIYVLKKGEGYFDLINRVRRDWNANFTIPGPYAFVYLKDTEGNFIFETSDFKWNINAVRKDPSKLREYLRWKPAKIVALMPWLDYDPGAFDRVISREEYKKLIPPLARMFKEVDPEIKSIGCIETPYTTLYLDGVEGADKLPKIKVGDSTKLLNKELTAEQVEIIKRGMAYRADSLILSADGKPSFELYVRGGKPIDPAVRVFPQVGNGHARFLREQVDFLLDEAGLDGVYFDMFALGQIGSMRTYLEGQWDGISAEMGLNSGEVHGKYIDCSLAAIDVKVELVNYLHSRGKVVVANRHSTSREEQSLPINRFTETGWVLNKMYWGPGTKPPAINYLFFGMLNSPIGLGINNPADGKARPEWLMKGLMTYLRHGQVYYHHTLREGPMAGPGSREFGPMKHMFPITPVELGEGFLIGEERIITAVSMDRLWKKRGRPLVRVFDMTGRAADADGRYEVKPEGGQWRVVLKLKDWAEIAVVE